MIVVSPMQFNCTQGEIHRVIVTQRNALNRIITIRLLRALTEGSDHVLVVVSIDAVSSLLHIINELQPTGTTYVCILGAIAAICRAI